MTQVDCDASQLAWVAFFLRSSRNIDGVMTKSVRRPGPESTLGEVRGELIEAGLELLRARGVDVSLGEITLSDAIAASGVTRSTAYRSLADDELAPQAVLHRELLNQLLTRHTRGEGKSTIEHVVAAEMQREAADLASGDVASRTRVLRGVIRVGCNASYQAVVDAPERSILIAIYGSLQSSTSTDWRYEALKDGEAALTTQFSELHGGLAELFDYRIKDPFTVSQFTTAGASLIEGMAMRQRVNRELNAVFRPTGPDAELEEWCLFGIAFEALFAAMWEPNSPDAPYADLSRY